MGVEDISSRAARPLTICAIGHARSIHVAARVRCFAELGHTVFLVTEQRSAAGIAGVAEYVLGPADTRALGLTGRLLSRLLSPVGIDPLHMSRATAFVRLLRRHRPDIVHVHFAHGWFAWYTAFIGCRPLVVSVMGGDILFDEQGIHTATTRWLTLELLRRADYITSKSHHLTSVLDQLGGFGAKTERVVWGVSTTSFRRTDSSALRSRLGFTPDRRVILSPRILQPLYRIHLLIEAMPLIVREIPETVALIAEHVPDPNYRSRLVERVSALGLSDHVVFCGDVAQDQMPELYSLAEMCVAVPSSDGLPQTLLEAMACGTPTMLGRLKRYEELVQHEHSAYFVEATPGAIAAGAIRLLRDAGLRARISRNGLEIVTREGDLDREAQRVLGKYRQLAASVPARILVLSQLWDTWRSFRRFHRMSAD